MKKTIFVLIFSLFYGACSTYVYASPQNLRDRPIIDISIGNDFSARGTWTIPGRTDSNKNDYWFGEYKNFGTTGVINYDISKIYDDKGKLETYAQPNHYQSVLTRFTAGGANVGVLYADYLINTELKTPLALYEFWVPNEGSLFSTQVNVNYPKDWKLVSVWPNAKETNPIVLQYPTATTFALRPVLVLFSPDSHKSMVKNVGRFTIAAESIGSLNKIEEAVNQLTFLDELFQKTLGTSSPSHITILSHDLTGADVGYEAEALATRPDIVIINDEFVKKRSVDEIKTTLVHEITHLVEFEQNLFSGTLYYAPWFREGLAVFVENYSEQYIFKDKEARAKHELVGSNRVLNSVQMKQLYKKDFDYFFDGTGYYGIPISYSHSGAVLRNFYEKVGVKGMRKLFDSLKNFEAEQLCASCDSEKIVALMVGIANFSSSDELLFPYKNSKNFDQDIQALVYPKYDDELVKKIYRTHVSNEIERYFPVEQLLRDSKPVVQEKPNLKVINTEQLKPKSMVTPTSSKASKIPNKVTNTTTSTSTVKALNKISGGYATSTNTSPVSVPTSQTQSTSLMHILKKIQLFWQ
jgi:hypothetical protein